MLELKFAVYHRAASLSSQASSVGVCSTGWRIIDQTRLYSNTTSTPTACSEAGCTPNCIIYIQVARTLKFAPLLLAPRLCLLQLLLPLIVWDIMYQSNHSVVHATNHWTHPLLCKFHVMSVEVIGNLYMWWRHLFSLTNMSEIKPDSSDSESHSFPNHCQIHLLSNSTIEGLRTRVG